MPVKALLLDRDWEGILPTTGHGMEGVSSHHPVTPQLTGPEQPRRDRKSVEGTAPDPSPLRFFLYFRQGYGKSTPFQHGRAGK